MHYMVFLPTATGRVTQCHIGAITVEACDHVTEYVSEILPVSLLCCL